MYRVNNCQGMESRDVQYVLRLDESAFKRMWVGRHGNAEIFKYPNWQPNHLLSLVRHCY